jgi:hypothetical protein
MFVKSFYYERCVSRDSKLDWNSDRACKGLSRTGRVTQGPVGEDETQERQKVYI